MGYFSNYAAESLFNEYERDEVRGLIRSSQRFAEAQRIWSELRSVLNHVQLPGYIERDIKAMDKIMDDSER